MKQEWHFLGWKGQSDATDNNETLACFLEELAFNVRKRGPLEVSPMVIELRLSAKLNEEWPNAIRTDATSVECHDEQHKWLVENYLGDYKR